MVDLFRTSQVVSVADAAAAVAVAAFARAVHPTEFREEVELAIASRLLVRLLNAGALELDREPA